MERPTILDVRYNGLDSNSRLREYKRDLLIYEQAKETERIANQTESNQINVQNREMQELKEELQLLKNKQNKDKQNDILDIHIRNLSNRDKVKYLNQKKIEKEEQDRKRLLQYRIDDAAEKIYYMLSKIQDWFNNNRLIHKKITNEKNKSNKLSRKINSINLAIQTGIISILIFGFIAVIFYVLYYNGSIEEALKIYGIILILYSTILYIYKIFTKIKYNKVLKNIDAFEFIEKYDFENDIKAQRINTKIPQNNQLEEYKIYAIHYLNNLKTRYSKNPKNFNKLNLGVIDRAILYISKIELTSVEDLLK